MERVDRGRKRKWRASGTQRLVGALKYTSRVCEHVGGISRDETDAYGIATCMCDVNRHAHENV